MIKTKINLSALKKENNASLNKDLEIKKDEIIETKNEVVEENKPKIKISLKWIKENTTSEKNEVIKQENLITPADNQWVVLEEKQVLNLEIQNLEKTEEKTEEKTTFSITDWDTQVNIVNEEKNEIFWSYKGSFSHTKDEIKWEKIKTIEEKEDLKKEEIKEEKIKLWSENMPNLQKEVQNISWETNLERYAKLNSNKKWLKKALVPVLSLVLVLWFSIWTATFLNSKNLKTNVVETKVIENQTQEVLTSKVENKKEEQIENNVELDTSKDQTNNVKEENIEVAPIETEEPKAQIDDINETNLEENKSVDDLNLDSLLNDAISDSINKNNSTDFVNENNLDTLDKNVIMKEKLRNHLLKQLKNN